MLACFPTPGPRTCWATARRPLWVPVVCFEDFTCRFTGGSGLVPTCLLPSCCVVSGECCPSLSFTDGMSRGQGQEADSVWQEPGGGQQRRELASRGRGGRGCGDHAALESGCGVQVRSAHNGSQCGVTYFAAHEPKGGTKKKDQAAEATSHLVRIATSTMGPSLKRLADFWLCVLGQAV